jgi:phospholipid/cholesterol/gamma-HCH transport system substrate-binding protein
MERKSREVQVGLITVGALLVLIVGIMWFKDISVSRGLAMYQIDFPTVEGLQVGDRIQVRGIRAGQVSGYEILDGFVRVQVMLDDSIGLREDAVFTLGTKGIVGEVVIEIIPGSGAKVAEGHIFGGRTAASITEMTDSAGRALEQMSRLTAKLDTLVSDIASEGLIVESLTKANRTLQRIDTILDENHEDFVAVMANLKSASGDLRELMDSGTVDTAFANAADAAARADSLMTSLAGSARRLDLIMTKLDEGEGSAALLLNDPRLYLSADSTLTSLHRLLDEMRRNPKKYFKLNVF